MAAQLKLQPGDDGFTRAIKQWLAEEKSGHLGPYMYVDDIDDHRWKDAHSAASYYLGRDDKATFDLALQDIDFVAENILDLGPGGEASVTAKSLPIIRATQARNYCSVDLSYSLANGAAYLAVNRLGITAKPVIADFFEPLPIVLPKALIAFMGGTLGNLETQADANSLQARLIQIFSNYRRAVSTESHFLVSFDANTNAEEILNCYRNKELGELIQECVDRAVDTSDFEYHVAWTQANYQLAMGLRSKRDQMVTFDEERLAVEQGQFLPVLNSYRFPVPFVIAAAKQAGWAHAKTWSATGRVHYLLFSAV